ncbi:MULTISPECIES: DUF6234 family protein [Streptomyces]|jgi:hypothetical protein|uniref:DUF6234 family protein n=1 Tax=Streptomyces mirabilis TaxID=68239 RepID=A0ABU3UUT4_9ACTN|nr:MULTISPECIES: DUF6234 family protein [Streptomyces]MCX4433972.1 DUF6234 family protein [Streptomyces mirabilis]MDU8997691.1 DUF6234 family protein [Streptomyces mirabilis]MDX3763137.1 DUF6234 family protein [Streptomyces sp. AK02-04a]
MTKTALAPERRRPWSRRTPLGPDLALAIPLFLVETAWLVVDSVLGLGMEVWAAQGNQAQVDTASLAYMGRVRVLLVTVLILAVLAGLFRAPGTVIAHLLVALLAAGVLGHVQQQWDHDHAPPAGCIRYSANC